MEKNGNVVTQSCSACGKQVTQPEAEAFIDGTMPTSSFCCFACLEKAATSPKS